MRRNVFLALLHAASFGLAFSRRVVALRNPDALIELLGDVIRFAASTTYYLLPTPYSITLTLTLTLTLGEHGAQHAAPLRHAAA